MAAGLSGSTMERFIVGAQKSTNQLKALLAKLLPAAGDARAGGGSSSSAVDALLSEITDSLSQALASLRCGDGAGALDTRRPPGQSSTGGSGGGRRSEPRRSGQRVRECQMIVLQNGAQDSYTWRKYGQKEILGARYPRSYFKCSRKSGCPAKKHVQQSDADASKLEIVYLDAHTCDEPPPPSSSRIVPDPVIVNSSGTQRNTAGLVPVATAPSAQRCTGQPSSFPRLVPDLMTAGPNVPGATGVPQPVADVVSSTQCDPVPDDTNLVTPSVVEEERGELLLIPSPACSQSELLPMEVAKVEPHGPPVWMDQDERGAISDCTVPELSISDYRSIEESNLPVQ